MGTIIRSLIIIFAYQSISFGQVAIPSLANGSCYKDLPTKIDIVLAGKSFKKNKDSAAQWSRLNDLLKDLSEALNKQLGPNGITTEFSASRFATSLSLLEQLFFPNESGNLVEVAIVPLSFLSKIPAEYFETDLKFQAFGKDGKPLSIRPGDPVPEDGYLILYRQSFLDKVLAAFMCALATDKKDVVVAIYSVIKDLILANLADILNMYLKEFNIHCEEIETDDPSNDDPAEGPVPGVDPAPAVPPTAEPPAADTNQAPPADPVVPQSAEPEVPTADPTAPPAVPATEPTGEQVSYNYGCTDPSALNYDSLANQDNGSCVPRVYGCMESWAVNYNGMANTSDWSCIFPVYGCTDSWAVNYNYMANTNDGSCQSPIYGCTDSWAINYNSVANTNDGSCQYPVYGCTDSVAANYDPSANVNNWTCYYATYGCTDSTAINYNWTANTNDGSCQYAVYGCTDSMALNFNPSATVNDWTCSYPVYGCTDPNASNYNYSANTNDGTCTYSVSGCTDPSASNYNYLASTNDGTCTYSMDNSNTSALTDKIDAFFTGVGPALDPRDPCSTPPNVQPQLPRFFTTAEFQSSPEASHLQGANHDLFSVLGAPRINEWVWTEAGRSGKQHYVYGEGQAVDANDTYVCENGSYVYKGTEANGGFRKQLDDNTELKVAIWSALTVSWGRERWESNGAYTINEIDNRWDLGHNNSRSYFFTGPNFPTLVRGDDSVSAYTFGLDIPDGYYLSSLVNVGTLEMRYADCAIVSGDAWGCNESSLTVDIKSNFTPQGNIGLSPVRNLDITKIRARATKNPDEASSYTLHESEQGIGFLSELTGQEMQGGVITLDIHRRKYTTYGTNVTLNFNVGAGEVSGTCENNTLATCVDSNGNSILTDLAILQELESQLGGPGLGMQP